MSPRRSYGDNLVPSTPADSHEVVQNTADLLDIGARKADGGYFLAPFDERGPPPIRHLADRSPRRQGQIIGDKATLAAVIAGRQTGEAQVRGFVCRATIWMRTAAAIGV